MYYDYCMYYTRNLLKSQRQITYRQSSVTTGEMPNAHHVLYTHHSLQRYSCFAVIEEIHDQGVKLSVVDRIGFKDRYKQHYKRQESLSWSC